MGGSVAPALRNRTTATGSGARLALAVLSLAVAPASCRAERPETRRPADDMSASHADSLRFELVAPAEVRAGRPVPIMLRLTNTGSRPLELHLQGREIAFDIVVARDDGAVVWRRLAGATIQGILQIRVLAPGQTLELKDVWRQRTDAGEPATAGNYTLWGVLPTDEPQPLRTPAVPLRIVPR